MDRLPINRVEQAEQLILQATDVAHKDPHGPGSLARAQVLIGLSIALLLRELVDADTLLIENDDEDEEGEKNPW